MSKPSKEQLNTWLDECCMNCKTGLYGSPSCRAEEKVDGCPSIVRAIRALIAAQPAEASQPAPEVVEEAISRMETAISDAYEHRVRAAQHCCATTLQPFPERVADNKALAVLRRACQRGEGEK